MMDVIGINPKAKVGEYYRANEAGWHPLANFILDYAPDEAKPCKKWHTNDGKGLTATQAIKLADKLNALIADGTAADALTAQDPPIKNEQDDYSKAHQRRNMRSWGMVPGESGPRYEGLRLNDIREFACFSRASGGFQIW